MKRHGGFTLVEVMVSTVILTVILTAMTLVFLAAENIWSITDTSIKLQDSLRQVLQRVSGELQESGSDVNGLLQAAVFDNTGVNGTDILRFAIPICPCGTSAMDANANVKTWGAPLAWGKTGCGEQYSVKANGKVDICHLPPGNPDNPQDIDVAPSSVQAHLAHGDWLGSCSACSPASYTNRWIEYKLNAGGQLIRRVLDPAGTEINHTVVSDDISNFQTDFVLNQNSLTLTVTVVRKAIQNRLITFRESMTVHLHNGS